MSSGTLSAPPAGVMAPAALEQRTEIAMKTGIVYTETVVHAAPEQFVAEAPYQLAIVTLDAGGRMTARIDGPRVAIGDKVELAEEREGIPFFRRVE